MRDTDDKQRETLGDDVRAVFGYAVAVAFILILVALVWGGGNDADGATNANLPLLDTIIEQQRVTNHLLQQIADGTCLNRKLC